MLYFHLCIIQCYDSIPKVGKSNEFKVNKVTAKIYNKTTGIKVTNDKIKDSMITIKVNSTLANNLKDYYGNITLNDQK